MPPREFGKGSWTMKGFPHSSVGKESACNADSIPGFYPWVRKIPWKRKWQPTPVLFHGKFHEQKSLADYGPWGHKRVEHDLLTKQQCQPEDSFQDF